MSDKFERVDNKFNRIASSDNSNDFYFDGYEGPRISEAQFGGFFKRFKKIPMNNMPISLNPGALPSELKNTKRQEVENILNNLPGMQGILARRRYLQLGSNPSDTDLNKILTDLTQLTPGGRASFLKNALIKGMGFLDRDKSQAVEKFKQATLKVANSNTKAIEEMSIEKFLQGNVGVVLTQDGIDSFNQALKELSQDVIRGAASKRTLSTVVFLARAAVLIPSAYLPLKGFQAFTHSNINEGTEQQFQQINSKMQSNSSGVTMPSASHGGITNQGNFGNLGGLPGNYQIPDTSSDTSNLPAGIGTTDPSVIRGSNENSFQKLAEVQILNEENIPYSIDDLFHQGILPLMQEYGTNNTVGLEKAITDYLNSIITSSNQVFNHLEQENQSGVNNEPY